MAVIAVFFDHAPEYLEGCDRGSSVLSLPLGTGRVLDGLVAQATAAGADRIFVVPTFEAGDAYEPRILDIGGNRLGIRPHHRLLELIQQHEGGDIFLAFDGRYWSEEWPEMSDIIGACRRHRTAVHLVSPASRNGIPLERILFDTAGRIRLIRRLYEKVAWTPGSGTVVSCSAIPQQLAETTSLYPIEEARIRLLSQGIPTHDRTLGPTMFDLCDPSDVLEVNRLESNRLTEAPHVPVGYSNNGRKALLADDCTLSPSARIIGPVIVQSGAFVGPHATLIGPCVIGQRVRVGKAALVARSVLPDDCAVPENSTVIRGLGPQPENSKPNRTPQGSSAGANGSRITVSRLRVAAEQGGRTLPALQASGLYPVLKRAVDIAGAVAGLLILLPFLPLIALLVKLESSGPLFFVHWREGLGGREFPCIKFRTMGSDAHKLQRDLYVQNEVDGPQFKLADDPRITRVGRWLRKLNIDELPQLINVLLGHMSLVGPRPSPFRENQICLAWREARLSVRPGITGLWQICRDRRADSDFNQWIYYDIKYVKHMSLWLDLNILLRTVTSLGGWRPVPLDDLIPSETDTYAFPVPAAPVAIA